MEVAVSGASGLLGTAVADALAKAGHRVVRLVRTLPEANSADIYWDPSKSYIDAAKLEGKDAVIHLAGETIAERWTAEKKKRIRESRLHGTALIAESLARLRQPPSVMVSASAIGYYGDRGPELLTEESAPGSGFLAELCREWEAAAAPAARAGVRLVLLRTGIVLSTKGGALAKMLPPFRLGAGGRLGSGTQYMSWIDLEDHAAAVLHLLQNESVRGPVNVVAPNPVTNKEFTKTLGKVLSRPTFATMPSFAVRLIFGEMGEALLLASQRVEPKVLERSGFQFRYASLEGSLRHLLSK